MIKSGLLIIQFIFLLLVLPVYASEVNQADPVEQLIISTLSEEAKNHPTIISDYSSNALAVKAVE
jgi:hypothetical protein